MSSGTEEYRLTVSQDNWIPADKDTEKKCRYSKSCNCNVEYIGKTQKKVTTRAMEYQQESIKEKWESSSTVKHCLEFTVQFNFLHQNILCKKARRRSRKNRKPMGVMSALIKKNSTP